MSISNKWVVVVFRCPFSTVKETLVGFYRFAEELNGVRSLHFLIRDRIEDEVVFSFRVMVEHKFKEIIKNKLANKLTVLLTKNKFSIDPSPENSLVQYVGWSPETRLVEVGQDKFSRFVDVLQDMSAFVIELVEKDYFVSSQRVEMAHFMSWMLGCTEYGMLSTSGMEVGYYDRLEDKYCSYLRQDLPKPNKKKPQTRLLRTANTAKNKSK